MLLSLLFLRKMRSHWVGDGLYEAKFYGLGADGTVGANKTL